MWPHSGAVASRLWGISRDVISSARVYNLQGGDGSNAGDLTNSSSTRIDADVDANASGRVKASGKQAGCVILPQAIARWFYAAQLHYRYYLFDQVGVLGVASATAHTTVLATTPTHATATKRTASSTSASSSRNQAHHRATNIFVPTKIMSLQQGYRYLICCCSTLACAQFYNDKNNVSTTYVLAI